ncbi:hypothetical protein ABZ920_02950 [Streptomyces sp. NPDC046831]|uniref:hypothetical protein n=1 Tax=Streptomyces sp. NPDC046831 TaxID=3154805 RepID=UPI0033F26DB4
MPARPTSLRLLVAAAVLPLALVSPAWGRPGPPPAASAAEAPATLCAPAGTLRSADRQWAAVVLCADTGSPLLAVLPAATCGRPATKLRYACRTRGTWTAARDGATVASGALPGSAGHPGPGTYEITATVRVRSAPAGVDLTGTVRTTLTLTAPGPAPARGSAGDGRAAYPTHS